MEYEEGKAQLEDQGVGLRMGLKETLGKWVGGFGVYSPGSG
jgi:hypothetical protein